MATTVGHAIVGAAIGIAIGPTATPRRNALWGAVAGAAADLDFLPGILLGDPGRFHHTFSHSVVFTLAVGFAVALLARDQRTRWALLATVAYGSHLLVDYFTWDNSVPQGIPLLWPFSSRVFMSSSPLLPNVEWNDGMLLSLHNLRLIGLEILYFAPVLAICIVLRRWWDRRARRNAVGSLA